MKKTAVFMFIVMLLSFCSCRFEFNLPEPTETTAQPEYVTDMHGKDVPVFENVEKSSFAAEKFVFDENGRATYDDFSVDTLTGIDVSVFQGDVDWSAVAADGIDFVILRVGGRGYGPEGALYEDEYFKRNFEGAKNAGLKVGVYFFSQAITVEEAVEEAHFLLNNIKDMELEMPVAYDWEHVSDASARTAEISGEQVTSFARAFCDTTKSAGYDTVIYFNREHGYFNYELSLLYDYDFWYAEYASYPSFLYSYTMWQYTERGKVAGIEGNVDINIALYDNSVG